MQIPYEIINIIFTYANENTKLLLIQLNKNLCKYIGKYSYLNPNLFINIKNVVIFKKLLECNKYQTLCYRKKLAICLLESENQYIKYLDFPLDRYLLTSIYLLNDYRILCHIYKLIEKNITHKFDISRINWDKKIRFENFVKTLAFYFIIDKKNKPINFADLLFVICDGDFTELLDHLYNYEIFDYQLNNKIFVCACKHNKLDIVIRMIQNVDFYQLKFNVISNVALTYACMNGHDDIVSILLSYDHPHLISNEAITVASKYGKLKVFIQIVEYFKKVNYKYLLLDIVCAANIACEYNRLNIMIYIFRYFFIELGNDLLECLYIVCRYDHAEICKYILRYFETATPSNQSIDIIKLHNSEFTNANSYGDENYHLIIYKSYRIACIYGSINSLPLLLNYIPHNSQIFIDGINLAIDNNNYQTEMMLKNYCKKHNINIL